jgi:DNA invertase Pin-like site-specific DNA recombinase
MQNSQLTRQTHRLITPDHLRRSAVIYIRQSTEENTGSTDFQRSLATVAQSYGWADSQIETIEEDLGRSGSSTERTGWQRLQVMIAARQVGAVFVANISRLSRQVLDFEVFRIMAAAHNTLLYADGRLVDPADSNDTMLSQVTAMVAHFENCKRTEMMSQARKMKAKQGAVVSLLPVGWIKSPDGRFTHDPETKDAIRLIIDTFWQTRSINRTVKALIKAGVLLPSRRGHRIYLRKPTLGRVIRILVNPSYAGTYIFGKTQSQPGAVLPNGKLKRMKVPEDRWIKTFNHHPAYMSQEQQEEIKSILKKNRFHFRQRVGRGPSLTQGLLRCAVCKRSLHVNYHRGKAYSYFCGWTTEPCVRFSSYEFDKFILAEAFKILEAPPLEMLKAALAETRSREQMRLKWIESERERIAHEEHRAEERAELTRASLPRVHFDALEKLEKVLQQKEEFEQKISLAPVMPKSDQSEEELEELCRLASDIPRLWHHPLVTHQERKEILRCMIDKVHVTVTKESIDATICWKSGNQTSFSQWRRYGRLNLIRQLDAQKLTVREIRDHLAAGKTSTGQVVNFTLGRIYTMLREMALKPNRYSTGYLSALQKAAEYHLKGKSFKWIAKQLNKEGLPSGSGKPWTSRSFVRCIQAGRYSER